MPAATPHAFPHCNGCAEEGSFIQPEKIARSSRTRSASHLLCLLSTPKSFKQAHHHNAERHLVTSTASGRSVPDGTSTAGPTGETTTTVVTSSCGHAPWHACLPPSLRTQPLGRGQQGQWGARCECEALLSISCLHGTAAETCQPTKVHLAMVASQISC